MLPGLGYFLAFAVALGGLAFNIGNVGGAALGFNVMLGMDQNTGAIVSAVIAIAIANDPDLIIADEPTTALDVTIQAQILDVLRAAKQETGAGVIMITHDLGVVAGMADRVAVMYAGRIVEAGDVDDIFYRFRMPYTIGLLGALPRLDSKKDSALATLDGSPPSLLAEPTGCPFAPRCPMAEDECLEGEPALTRVRPDGGSDASGEAPAGPQLSACRRFPRIEEKDLGYQDIPPDRPARPQASPGC